MAWAMVNVMDSRVIFSMNMGFYTLWTMLGPPTKIFTWDPLNPLPLVLMSVAPFGLASEGFVETAAVGAWTSTNTMSPYSIKSYSYSIMMSQGVGYGLVSVIMSPDLSVYMLLANDMHHGWSTRSISQSGVVKSGSWPELTSRFIGPSCIMRYRSYRQCS